MDISIIENIICKGIKQDAGTMKFLRDKALSIFQITRLEWIASQDSQEDVNNPDFWDEFVTKSKVKFEKYIFGWFDELKENLSFPNIPFSIISIFSSILDETISRAMFFDIACPMIDEIYSEFRENLPVN